MDDDAYEKWTALRMNAAEDYILHRKVVSYAWDELQIEILAEYLLVCRQELKGMEFLTEGIKAQRHKVSRGTL